MLLTWYMIRACAYVCYTSPCALFISSSCKDMEGSKRMKNDV
uniref:Uncharacterized protein n=1 Tax=Setaria italica TaxID=4555 RepID=K3ZGC7_SETIT